MLGTRGVLSVSLIFTLTGLVDLQAENCADLVAKAGSPVQILTDAGLVSRVKLSTLATTSRLVNVKDHPLHVASNFSSEVIWITNPDQGNTYFVIPKEN